MARILIIDDSEDLRRLTVGALQVKGHEVFEAPDGERGLQVQSAQRADLIITDLFMPNKDGMETIVVLRQRFPGVKIIAISGGGPSSNNIYLKAALEIGADDVLEKPHGLAQLCSAVERVLTRA